MDDGVPAPEAKRPAFQRLSNLSIARHQGRGCAVNRILQQLGVLLGDHVDDGMHVADHPECRTGCPNL